MTNAYKSLVGKPEGKRLSVRSRRRWEDVIRMDLREQGGKVWTGFIWLSTGTSEHGNEPLGSIKGGDFLD
jgi:hypothetical protein